MKAIVLAAGVGKRFKEVTDQRPKCLIEIQGKTLLERTLSALSAAGVVEAVVVIGYRGEMIEQQIGAVPVIGPDGTLVGIVSYVDMLRELVPLAASA